MTSAPRHTLRIGELSRRVGLSAEVLRAWERRYGVLQPARSGGGFRLYSEDDERRIRLMRDLLDRGLSPAEAARLVLAEPAAAAAPAAGWQTDAAALAAALDELDEQSAQAAFDRLLAALTVETVLDDVLIPYLRELGERWEGGEATVAQEHFASNVLRGRLLGLARGWGLGLGPLALLACPPGELHDLPLVAFGVALRQRGWRLTFLGADTPVANVAEAADRLLPQLAVLSAVDAARFEAVADDLAFFAGRHSLALAGAGASPELAEQIGCRVLDASPVRAAELLATGALPPAGAAPIA